MRQPNTLLWLKSHRLFPALLLFLEAILELSFWNSFAAASSHSVLSPPYPQISFLSIREPEVTRTCIKELYEGGRTCVTPYLVKIFLMRLVDWLCRNPSLTDWNIHTTTSRCRLKCSRVAPLGKDIHKKRILSTMAGPSAEYCNVLDIFRTDLVCMRL